MSARAIGIIPARWASSRFPGKPLAQIAGKPMIQWVWERASRAETLERVLIATDDARIEAAAREFGAEVVMTPTDLKSGSDRVAWVARDLPEYDVVANVQGDEPLLQPWVLDTAVRLVLEDDRVPVATLARVVEDPAELRNVNTARVVLDREGFALYFSRAVIPFCRDVPNLDDWPACHPFYDQIGLYVYRRDVLLAFTEMEPTSLERAEKLEQLRLLQNGIRIKVGIVDFRPVCVDTPADLEVVRKIVEGEQAQRAGRNVDGLSRKE